MNLSELFGKIAVSAEYIAEWGGGPSKPCPCCHGTGEHDEGECQLCDGGMTVSHKTPDDAQGRDCFRTASQDAGVYRGMSLVLPPDIHKMVHDPAQPHAARAHLLLSEIRKQKETHSGEEGATGPSGGLGSFWTPQRSKAEEYADQNGFSAYREHENEHRCGDEDYGDGGCPTTRVVVHALTPHEKHQWKEVFRPGERYDPDLSWRLPIRPGAPMRVRGISWREGNDQEPPEVKYSEEGMKASREAPYDHYDFAAEVRKRATRAKDLDWHTAQHYLAETAFTKGHPQRQYADLGEAQAHADKIAKDEGVPAPRVVQRRGGPGSVYWHSGVYGDGEPEIGLRDDHMHEAALIHEMTHHVRHVNGQPEGHDPGFSRDYGLALWEHHSRPDAARAEFNHYYRAADEHMRANPEHYPEPPGKTAAVSFGPGGEQPKIGEDHYEEDDGYYKGLWDRWHPLLQPTIHRHLALDLPADHPVHDSSRSTEERAHALLDHASQGGGYRSGRLGYHWTDNPDYDHLANDGRLRAGQTPAIIHAKTPPRDHIEDNEHELTENRAVRDWDTDEREVPLKSNAPVHVTGATWYSPDGWQQHHFQEPVTKLAGANGDLPEGLQLDFHPHYTNESWLPRQDTGQRDTFHKVVAHVPGSDGRPVYAGEMSWYPHTGEVALVRVPQAYRRRGIASAMWDHGLKMAKEQGLTPPRHSESQTDAGSAWARTTAKTATLGPEDYAKQEGENGYDHETRIRHGLSMGHLTYEQAENHGYYGGGREDNRDSWTREPNGKGWQSLPKELWHTTTDAAGVMAHGLKSAGELGQRSGHGLGGTPQWLSLTDREDHAHNMLDALHEYHDHLNGKTTFADLHKAAQNGEGAQHPFHKAFLSAFGNEPDAAREARMQGKRIEPGFAAHEEAKAKGWEPHPEFHQNFGEGKDGRTYGGGWLRPSTVEERHEEYGAFSRARDFEGKGKPSILFLSNDRKTFAAKDPSNFAVLRVKPKPGAQGFPMEGEHEWRTGTGQAVKVDGEPIRRQASRQDSEGQQSYEVDLDAMDSASSGKPAPTDGPYVTPGTMGTDSEGHRVQMTTMDGWAHDDGSHGHEDNTTIGDKPVYTQDHTWLPNGRYWGPNSAQNDQRLFEGDHLRPEVRQDTLKRVDSFMRPRYHQWPSWTRVYFAGSEAARWAPFNGDLDVILGADFDKFRQTNPEYADQDDDAIAKMITDGMWHTINVDGYWFTLADGRKVGPFDRTFFLDAKAWDIRDIKPYAAYNVTDDTWAVYPLEVPKDWDATYLPESYWRYAEAVLNEIKAIGTLPPEERHRMAANLWEELHTHRSDAFNGNGKGLFDLSNIIEKYLDQHPDKPWAQLVQWKSEAPSGPEPWVPTNGRTTLSMLFGAKKEPKGADYDGIMIAFVPPKSVGKKLLVEDGEPLEALHVTLCYLGSAKEHTKAQMDGLESLVRAWARTQKPFEAKVGGAGTFHNPDQHVLMAHVDIPGGGGIRHSLNELLVEHEYKVRNDHGWTPHITLKYDSQPVRFLPKVEPKSWKVREVMLCVGGTWTPVALGA